MKKLLLTLLLLFSLGFAATAQTTTEGAEWVLVTDASSLAPGDKLTIVNIEKQKGMSTDKNTDNRKSIDVTFYEDNTKLSFTTEPLIVELGGTTGAWTFKTLNYGNGPDDNGYFASATSGSKNNLKVQAAAMNASIAITNKNAEIKFIPSATGTFNRTLLRYNDTYGLFACYSTGQQDVQIFRYESTGPSVTYTTSPKEYKLKEGSDADNKVEFGTKVTFTAKNFTDTPYIEVYHDENAKFDDEGTYTTTIDEETIVEIKDGGTVIATYNFTPVAEPLEATFQFSGENGSSYGLTPQTDESRFEVNEENPVSELTEGIVKINLAGEKYRYWNNDKTLRVQTTSSLTISVPETHYITEIVFEGTNTSGNVTLEENCGTFNNGKWSAGDLTVSSVKFAPEKVWRIKSITIKFAERPVPATEIVGLSYKLTGKSKAIVVDYTIHIKNHKDTDTYKLMLSVDGGEPIEITPEGTPAPRTEGTPEAAPARVATGANASLDYPAEGATHDLAGTYTATIDEDKAARHTVSLAVHLNDAETADYTADDVTIG
ncbi:MAG: hypothetical protein K2L27_04540, partial [Muribaculaceae bacterium]|nr:hypothetical protein [Muribaculaceae bacterium]